MKWWGKESQMDLHYVHETIKQYLEESGQRVLESQVDVNPANGDTMLFFWAEAPLAEDIKQHALAWFGTQCDPSTIASCHILATFKGWQPSPLPPNVRPLRR
jgi:hypothetical protein